MWIKLKASKHKIRVKISIFPLKSGIHPGVVFFFKDSSLPYSNLPARFPRNVSSQPPIYRHTEVNTALSEAGKLIEAVVGSPVIYYRHCHQEICRVRGGQL